LLCTAFQNAVCVSELVSRMDLGVGTLTSRLSEYRALASRLPTSSAPPLVLLLKPLKCVAQVGMGSPLPYCCCSCRSQHSDRRLHR
jgi:hypothetical protein